MAVDERRRLQLADAAKRTLGDDAGVTLMELLPPTGWADVVTKHDLQLALDALESRLEARFERGFRQILVAVSSLIIGAFLATIAATVTAVLLR